MLKLELQTGGRGFVDITAEVQRVVRDSGHTEGLCTLFIRHTSASLLITENADRAVRTDLENFFARLVPDGDPRYVHDAEGADDMPAHIRAALTLTQLSIPVEHGRMALGAWQGVYLFEHRAAPHRRAVLLHLIGEA